MKKIFLIFSFWFLFLLVGGQAFNSAHGAVISQRLETRAEDIGDKFKVSVWLETGGESLNAIEGKLIWPLAKLKLIKIEEEDSIISLWVRKPIIGEIGEINFAGLIPGGYAEAEGQLFTLGFEVLELGRGEIVVSGGQALLNNGQGTPANLVLRNLDFEIGNQPFSLSRKLFLFFSFGIIISILTLWIFRRRKNLSV